MWIVMPSSLSFAYPEWRCSSSGWEGGGSTLRRFLTIGNMLREQHPRDRRTGISIPRTLWSAVPPGVFCLLVPIRSSSPSISLSLAPFFACGCAYVCDCAAQAEPPASRAPTKYKTFYLRLSRGLTWSPNGKHRHKDKLYNCSLKREKRQIGKYTYTDVLTMHTRWSLFIFKTLT